MKTVRLIREAVVDKKLAGAECMEAFTRLFIPLQWPRPQYLYETPPPVPVLLEFSKCRTASLTWT